jgi:hypothetical protein
MDTASCRVMEPAASSVLMKSNTRASLGSRRSSARVVFSCQALPPGYLHPVARCTLGEDARRTCGRRRGAAVSMEGISEVHRRR